MTFFIFGEVGIIFALKKIEKVTLSAREDGIQNEGIK